MTRARKGRILVYTNSIGGKPIDPTNLADGTVIVYDQTNDVYHYVDLTTVFALIDHTHSQYLTAITKAMVEGVLTGNITTHVHNQYLTAITKAMVEAVLTGTITSHNHNGTYAPVVHNHDADYSPIGHDHAGVYAPATHSHAEYLTGITKAMVEAVLTGTITSHNHSGVYALVAHNHDGVYEPVITKNTAFNKNFGTTVGTVAEGNHTHSQYLQSITKAMVEAVLTGTITSHNHSGVYSPATHAHDDRYYTETEVDDLLAGKSGTAHTHDDRYFTESEINTLLAGKSDSGHNHSGVYEPAFTKNTAFNKNFGTTLTPTAHTHDDRYYTETDVDTLLSGKAASSHTHDDRYYTESEITTLLAGKSDSGHNHSGVYEPAFTKNTAFNKNFGTAVGTVCQGNDARLSDSRTPKAHTHDDRYYTESEVDTLLAGKSATSHNHDTTYLGISAKAVDSDKLDGLDSTAFATAGHNHSGVYEPVFTKNTAFNKNFGTTAGTVCQGNDSRLSDARTPTSHTHSKSQITDFPSSMPASDVYAWAKASTKPSYSFSEVGAAPSSHTHDDRYYTESEVNSLLSGKSDTSHSHSYLPLAGGNLTGKVASGSANRSAGMYGYYVSTAIGHVWSMGTAYAIPDNGADFGNLYGMAYKHTNNTTGGTMAGGHQIVFCSAGTPGAAIGLAGAIWAKTGFLKNGSSDSYLLLGGGGHKAISDFAISGHNHSGVYEPAFSKGTAFNKNFGTTVDTVCQGNDSRLSDARTPTAHTHDDRYYTETEVNNLIAGKSDTSHNHSGVYEPAFSKNNAFNKNFGTAAGTVCQGNDSRLSNVRTPSDNSVTYAKLNTTLTSRQAVGASAIDWSLGGVYTKTLTAATTFTFSNLQLNKVITLVASGNFTITLPAYCKRISGEYDGSTTNYIQFHCTNNASGSEEVWYTISKQAS